MLVVLLVEFVVVFEAVRFVVIGLCEGCTYGCRGCGSCGGCVFCGGCVDCVRCVGCRSLW